MRTYFKQPDKQNNWLDLQVHLQAAVELLFDVLHVLAVARPPKHPLCGRPFLPQQHQHLLVKEQGLRFLKQKQKQTFKVRVIDTQLANGFLSVKGQLFIIHALRRIASVLKSRSSFSSSTA